jgi:hypothetical protein
MYHLHLVLKNREETQYELSLKQCSMYEQIKEENIDDIIIYNDSRFNESDKGFIMNDLKNELKKQYGSLNIYEEKMKFYTIKANHEGESILIKDIPSISMESSLIIKTDDLDGLLNKLYGLSDFYQMMYKYKPLEPEPENCDEENVDVVEEEDEAEEEFQYY